jgi:hypothetical protein
MTGAADHSAHRLLAAGAELVGRGRLQTSKFNEYEASSANAFEF